MKKAILIQARLSSSRFPKKMMEKIGDLTLLEFVYHRCKKSQYADDVIILTSIEKTDDALYNLCIEKQIPVFRGDLNNVLKRYIDAADHHKVDVICRVCGDSPLVDYNVIDMMFHHTTLDNSIEYLSTSNSLNGFISEVFTLDLLKNVYNKDLADDDKEHVTKYIRDNIINFNTKEFDINLRPQALQDFTLTVDYPEDIVLIRNIVNYIKDFNFTSNDIIKILNEMKETSNEF